MKKLNIRQFGIGTLMKYPPLISSDSKYIFTIGDGCVYVWIVKTGLSLRIINLKNNSNDQQHQIISISINPFNRLQLCIGEDYGNITVWDYEDGILIHRIEIEMELIQLNSISNHGLYLFTKTNKNNYSLCQIESIRHQSSRKTLFEKLPCLPKSISFDQKGDLCVFRNVEGTILYVLDLKNSQIKVLPITKSNLSYHEKITCVEIHPHGECLALGTQSGRIALWYNFLDHSKNEIRICYLHWHSLSVNCLSFSFDGSYLLSGGSECVLVKWNYQKSEPTFRPRLGAPILHLTSSNDQTFYLTTHSDNILYLIGSHLTIEQTIAGMNHIFLPNQSSLPAGIHIFESEQALVMNSGKSGHLQFMSIDNGKLLYNLDIVGENFVCSSDVTEECLFTDIKRLAIHSSDEWLVTFEERSKINSIEDHQNERKLRFWKYSQTNRKFELNTSITYPHGQESLNEILFHPHRIQLSTTGNDGFVKIWNLIEENSITKRRCHWRCSSVYSHRSYSSNALCYSLLNEKINLCSSFEHLVILWIERNEENDYEYNRSFVHYDRLNLVKSIHSYKDQILISHQRLINLWNIENGLFLKSFSWNVHSISQHPTLPFIAIFEKSFLHFYSFNDGKCHSRKNSLFRRVTSSKYIPNEKSSSSFPPLEHSKLIFYIPEEGLKTFVHSDDDEEEEEEVEEGKEMDITKNKRTILGDLIKRSQNGIDQTNGKKRLKKFDDLSELNQKINSLNEQLFTSPSYLFPSIDHYCIQSLKEMLLPTKDKDIQIKEKDFLFNEHLTMDDLSNTSIPSEEEN